MSKWTGKNLDAKRATAEVDSYVIMIDQLWTWSLKDSNGNGQCALFLVVSAFALAGAATF